MSDHVWPPLSGSVDAETTCILLQDAINDATTKKVAALEAYTKNPSDAGVCEEYVEALQNRIEKIQEMLDSGCIEIGGANYLNLQAAINEDQDTLEGLNC